MARGSANYPNEFVRKARRVVAFKAEIRKPVYNGPWDVFPRCTPRSAGSYIAMLHYGQKLISLHLCLQSEPLAKLDVELDIAKAAYTCRMTIKGWLKKGRRRFQANSFQSCPVSRGKKSQPVTPVCEHALKPPAWRLCWQAAK